MTDSDSGLYFEINKLATACAYLSPRGTAAVFGVCAAALAPLLKQVEEQSDDGWTVPELPAAIELIKAFATGSTESSDYPEVRERLLVTVPARHPWRTYAQDVLICADAGLASASMHEHPAPQLIHSALEPLIVWAEGRDLDIIRTYGDDHWDRELVNDPLFIAALEFLRGMIAKASRGSLVDPLEFDRWVAEAAVLRPVEGRSS